MSEVWKYFEKLNSEKAQCSICKKQILRNQSSTRGLWIHLKSKHPNEFKCLKPISTKDNDKKGQQEKVTKFLKIDAVMNSEEQLARIMIRQNTSFSFFEDNDLKSLVAKAYPNIQLKGSCHYKRIVIPRMAEKIRVNIKEGIDLGFYSITSDGWSNPSRIPHLNPKIGAADFADFELLRQVCPILEVFHQITLRFSKETSTASEVLPILCSKIVKSKKN